MANILIVTSGLTGILNASLEMARRLITSGHRVQLAAPRDVDDQVKKNGFEFYRLPEIPVETSLQIPVSGKLSKLIYRFKNRRALQEEALKQLIPTEFQALVKNFRPDLTLIDVELHEYIFHAYSAKRPFVILSQWFTLWPAKKLPSLLSDIIPGEGFRGSTFYIGLNWFWIKIKRHWMFGKKRLRSAGTDRRSTLIRYANLVGFPLTYIRENYWPGPFSYRNLPVWSMTMQELEFPHRKRDYLSYIGPMVFASRTDSHIEQEELDRLESLYEQASNQSLNIIYCSMSTMRKSNVDFVTRVMAAISRNPKWLGIISLAGDQTEKFESFDGVHIFSRVPQMHVLQRADLCIHHGGIHTINECIHYRVPMLVYSGKASDQNVCAARLSYHKLALIGDRDSESKEEIHQKIETLLSGEEFAINIQAYFANYQKYMTNGVLENKVNELTRENLNA